VNLVATLQARADERGDTTAFVHGGRRCTIAELAAASERGAAELVRRGIGPGDHVLCFATMGIGLYQILMALWRVGAVAVFVDPGAGAPLLAHACDRLRPKAFVGVPKAMLLRLLRPALRRIPVAFSTGFTLLHASWPRAARRPGTAPMHEVGDEHPALITFTSGSTGHPKAAVRSHGFLRRQHEVLEATLAPEPGKADLATLPIFALANLASGVTTVIPPVDLRRPGAIRTGPVLATIARERPQSCVASPAFFARLLATGTELRLRRVWTGGAPVYPRLWRRLDAALGDGRAFAVYGSTEAEPIAHLAWDEVGEDDRRAMAEGAGLVAGPAVPQTDCAVVADRAGTPREPCDGAAFAAERTAGIGEIVVAGAHVLPGYLDGIGDREAKWRVDGRVWHRTGDAGRLDQGGRLWLQGRCAAVIRDERGLLAPFAVETAVDLRHRVERAAVVARDGRRLLVASGVEDPAALERSARELGCDELRLLRRIPLDRRHNAKVDYPALERVLARIDKR